ncbi:hypothetical protein HYZ41_01165 [archaeon]|nr:hypothetical protein [archaeon]
MTDSIEEVIFPAIGLVFLLLGIVLLASILFSAFNPYDQIAFINAEKLRAKIDEACMTNNVMTTNSIELRQNTPSFTWAFSILPRWLIRSGGDPNYVLYYEAFPPGEATGWEVYHDMQARIITPVTDDFLKSQPTQYAGQSVMEYVKEKVEKAYTGSDKIDSIIISNIVLSEDFRADYRIDKKELEKFTSGGGSFGGAGASTSWKGGPVEEAKKSEEKFFSYGKWRDQDKDTKIPLTGADNVFMFSNYMSLSPSEKTAIKYMPCGVNSLCLKTRSGIYSFPLHQCNVKGVPIINDILIDYNGGGDVPLGKKLLNNVKSALGGLLIWITKGTSPGADLAGGGLIASAISDSLVNSLQYKLSEFYIVSPCTISDKQQLNKITIQKKECKDVCESYISYPIYSYDSKNQKLNPTNNNHFVCTRSIGNTINNPPDNLMPGQCIVVSIAAKKSDYCWTPQPKDTGLISNLWNSVKQLYPPGVVASAVLNIGYGYPITGNTAFIAPNQNLDTDNMIILKPTQTALKEGEGFFESLDRKLFWGWP